MRPHLYKRPCPSVGWLVGPSVRRSVMLSSKSMKNRLLRILNDLDSAGRGKKRDVEEGGTRRKEEWGGRRVEDEGGAGRKEGRGEWKKEKAVTKMKNEKVAKGRIIGLAGTCFFLLEQTRPSEPYRAVLALNQFCLLSYNYNYFYSIFLQGLIFLEVWAVIFATNWNEKTQD